MSTAQYILAIFLMSLVTFLPRLLPVLLLSGRALPFSLIRWLSYIPAAVLAALLAPALFAPDGKLDLSFGDNPGFWVSIPVFLVAFLSRSLFATVLAGMGLMAVWRFLV